MGLALLARLAPSGRYHEWHGMALRTMVSNLGVFAYPPVRLMVAGKACAMVPPPLVQVCSLRWQDSNLVND